MMLEVIVRKNQVLNFIKLLENDYNWDDEHIYIIDNYDYVTSTNKHIVKCLVTSKEYKLICDYKSH